MSWAKLKQVEIRELNLKHSMKIISVSLWTKTILSCVRIFWEPSKSFESNWRHNSGILSRFKLCLMRAIVPKFKKFCLHLTAVTLFYGGIWPTHFIHRKSKNTPYLTVKFKYHGNTKLGTRVGVYPNFLRKLCVALMTSSLLR